MGCSYVGVTPQPFLKMILIHRGTNQIGLAHHCHEQSHVNETGGTLCCWLWWLISSTVHSSREALGGLHHLSLRSPRAVEQPSNHRAVCHKANFRKSRVVDHVRTFPVNGYWSDVQLSMYSCFPPLWVHQSSSTTNSEPWFIHGISICGEVSVPNEPSVP